MLCTHRILLCATFTFSKFKSVPKGIHFRAIEVIHEKTADWLKAVSQNNFRECFETREDRLELVSFGLILLWRGQYVNTKI